MTRLRRLSSLRRNKRKSKTSKKKFRSSSSRAIPSAFAAFNAAKSEAEYRGDNMFEWNGKQYMRHAWNNGVSVWRRA